MLVTFDSSVSGEMIMLGETAGRLLDILGKARSARGVITAEQLPAAIARLRSAVREDLANPPPVVERKASASDDEAPDELPIGLAQRAYPFIEMLERTQREKDGYVMWQAAGDF